jgi:hypothetical protein
MKNRSFALRAIALTVSVFLATGGVIQTSASAAVAPLVSGTSPGTVVQGAVPITSIASIRIIRTHDSVANAEQLLTTSRGHTMNDSTRQVLTDAVTATTSELALTMTNVGSLAAKSTTGRQPITDARATHLLAAEIRDLGALSIEQTKLTAAIAAVVASEASHTKQLRQAARLAAEAYHEVVWTSGFQAQIDACRGAVNLSGAYHVRVIGEEWQCGGARFPRQGTLVRLSGIMSGLYRVGPVVAVLNAYVDRSGDIPRGYALLYQTCRYGNAHTETFTELIPVG